MDEEKGPVLVFVSANVMEARQVLSLLEGSGVHAMILNDHTIGLNPFLAGPTGQVQICIPADEVESATEILKEQLGYSGGLPMQGSTHPFAPRSEEP